MLEVAGLGHFGQGLACSLVPCSGPALVEDRLLSCSFLQTNVGLISVRQWDAQQNQEPSILNVSRSLPPSASRQRESVFLKLSWPAALS